MIDDDTLVRSSLVDIVALLLLINLSIFPVVVADGVGVSTRFLCSAFLD